MNSDTKEMAQDIENRDKSYITMIGLLDGLLH